MKSMTLPCTDLVKEKSSIGVGFLPPMAVRRGAHMLYTNMENGS
jgi:hypothetical protein